LASNSQDELGNPFAAEERVFVCGRAVVNSSAAGVYARWLHQDDLVLLQEGVSGNASRCCLMPTRQTGCRCESFGFGPGLDEEIKEKTEKRRASRLGKNRSARKIAEPCVAS